MTPYSPYKGKSGIKRIFNATGYSLQGLKLHLAMKPLLDKSFCLI
jgi:diacylglycerol kinase